MAELTEGRAELQGQRGFSLIEMLVVLAILGMIALIMTVVISKAIKRERLHAAAQSLASFISGAMVLARTQRTSIFVTAQGNADGSCTFKLIADTNGNNQLDANDQVLSTQLVTNDIAVAGLSVGSIPGAPTAAWPNNNNGTVELMCDSLGRTMDPTKNPPTQIQQDDYLSLTHQEMLAGTLGPHLRYDISIAPIWNLNITTARY